MKYKSVEHSFFSKIDQSGECWEWKASQYKFGYGAFYNGKKVTHAHIFSYEIHFGEIPKGLFILHSCDNPKCVNPDHLRAGTQKENVKDMIDRKRAKFGFKRKIQNNKVFCINGHDVTEAESLYKSKNGYTACKICRRSQANLFKEKLKVANSKPKK